MSGITAAAVKSLREKTDLPMMECKKALIECNGDEEAAIAHLRKKGRQTQDTRAGRATAFGRVGIYFTMEPGVGAMVELKCESAQVAGNEEFIAFANDLAKQLAENPAVETPEQLLALPCSIAEGTLSDKKDDMFNRIREVFNVGRMVRIDAPCGGYTHNSGTISGVLIAVEGGDPDTIKDIAMHVAAMRPTALAVEDLDAALVANEKDILTEAARSEGKPENIIEKMVVGRMQNFYATCVLSEQPFVKDDKQTVKAYAASKGMTLKQFVHWELGVE